MNEPMSLAKCQLIAGLCTPVPSVMFVTSPDWSKIAREAQEHIGEATRLDTANFQQLIVGGVLTVVNSGTEDQEVCNILNRPFAERANFAWKRDNLRVA